MNRKLTKIDNNLFSSVKELHLPPRQAQSVSNKKMEAGNSGSGGGVVLMMVTLLLVIFIMAASSAINISPEEEVAAEAVEMKENSYYFFVHSGILGLVCRSRSEIQNDLLPRH